MAMIETGIPLTARIDFRDARLPIVPRGGNVVLLSTVGFQDFLFEDLVTKKRSTKVSYLLPYPYSVSYSVATNQVCHPLRYITSDGSTAAFRIVMPSENIAYIDTYQTGGAEYYIGGTNYSHRIYFYLASLQIDTAEKVTKYDDERGTIIPLSATNYTTYTLQTMNTDAYTLSRLMKISNNDHITLNYIDANGNSQSVNLIRTTEAPSIERYPKMSSGSFSCKFVKI